MLLKYFGLNTATGA